MTNLFDFDFRPKPSSKQLAEAGMEQAVDHADRVEDGWSDRALQNVRLYASFKSEFLGEDVRTWAHEQGLPLPPKACAWGAVMVRAAKEGIVERAGYGTTKIPPQHSKPAVRWRSLVMGRQA